METQSFRVLLKIVKKKKSSEEFINETLPKMTKYARHQTNKVISKPERGIIFPTNLEATPEYFFPLWREFTFFPLTVFLIILARSAFARQNGARKSIFLYLIKTSRCYARRRITLFHRRGRVVCPPFAIFLPLDFNATDFRR